MQCILVKSDEFVPPYIFPLNPDYVAACSLWSLPSNNHEKWNLFFFTSHHVSHWKEIQSIAIVYYSAMSCFNYAFTLNGTMGSLVEIQYTLSILQVYFICTSQKKSIFEVYLVCTSRKKYKWSIFGKCTSFILLILKYTLSILLQTSVLVKNSFAKKNIL